MTSSYIHSSIDLKQFAPYSKEVCPPCSEACDCQDRRLLRR
ncbi:hypothetical protein [uncultured Victivallis sp.]|nr:hypothetical protein [uncultured Victivallis sp.]